jgi:hypothetical protein
LDKLIKSLQNRNTYITTSQSSQQPNENAASNQQELIEWVQREMNEMK